MLVRDIHSHPEIHTLRFFDTLLWKVLWIIQWDYDGELFSSIFFPKCKGFSQPAADIRLATDIGYDPRSTRTGKVPLDAEKKTTLKKDKKQGKKRLFIIYNFHRFFTLIKMT